MGAMGIFSIVKATDGACMSISILKDCGGVGGLLHVRQGIEGLN